MNIRLVYDPDETTLLEAMDHIRAWAKDSSRIGTGLVACRYMLDNYLGLLAYNQYGVCVGSVAYKIDKNCLTILWLATYKHHSGVGSILMNELLKVAFERRCDEILVEPLDSALRFYEHFGFVYAYQDLDGVVWHKLSLERELA